MRSTSSLLEKKRSSKSSSLTPAPPYLRRNSWSESVGCGRSAISLARAVENLFFHVGIHERGAFLAPDAHGVFDTLIRDLLVAFADDHVDRRLAADKLRQRRDHDRIAEFGAHLRRFVQGLTDLSPAAQRSCDAGGDLPPGSDERMGRSRTPVFSGEGVFDFRQAVRTCSRPQRASSMRVLYPAHGAFSRREE